MSEVIYPPKKNPVIFLISYIEVFTVKNKNIGKLAAVIKGELVIVWKFLKLFLTDSPGLHGRYFVFTS
jgi:hypothetical protein